MSRKIIVSIATSADGYIARKDGSFDWLDRPMPEDHYGMDKFVESIDTILWGRKTWDQAVEMGNTAMSGVKANFVFSRQPKHSTTPNLEFISQPVGEFSERLRSESGKDIWIMGGGQLIASFLDAGQIDEFIIHVIPVFIGEGIPLIHPAKRTIPVELIDSKRFPDGVVHLHYGVPR
jgi:dihydrofolate reductase